MTKWLIAILLGLNLKSIAQCPPYFKLERDIPNRLRCIFDGIKLPSSGSPRSYCHYVFNGYIGYVWDLKDDNADYMCPRGLNLLKNQNLGTGYCLADPFDPPLHVSPYCDLLESHGIIGFEFDEER